jgi:antirestriction protein
MDISKYENTAPVWVGNLGKYNEGELVGGWITLPVSTEELDKFLHDKVQIGTQDAFGNIYEEYLIFDTDEYDNTLIRKLGLDVGEHTGLYGLNDLAKICSTLSDYQLEALSGYLEIDFTRNVYDVSNFALQVDDISLGQFDGDLPEHWSDEEKFAYTMANEDGLYAFLDKYGIVDYFNFEAYGKDTAQDVTFTENGWIWNGNTGLDSSRYDLKEISELADQRFKLHQTKTLRTTRSDDKQFVHQQGAVDLESTRQKICSDRGGR